MIDPCEPSYGAENTDVLTETDYIPISILT